MKYYDVLFSIKADESLRPAIGDVLGSMLGEAGFESFQEAEEGLHGFIRQEFLDIAAIDAVIGELPFPEAETTFSITEAPDEDWNAAWEAEGFDPIVVRNEGCRTVVVIHDGRHLPAVVPSGEDTLVEVEIDARLAFGTGSHETTRLMVGRLAGMPLKGKRLIDCGCGTGILAISALLMGCDSAVGYDIDEWSVDNARHNAVINRVDDRFEPLLGDSRVLEDVEGKFDIVVANINRNVLLADMAAFRHGLAEKGTLLLSGFYTEDAPLLIAAATASGLSLHSETEENGWCCLALGLDD